MKLPKLLSLLAVLSMLPALLVADSPGDTLVLVELPRRAQVGHRVFLAIQGPEVYGTRKDPEYPLVIPLDANHIAQGQVEGRFSGITTGAYVVSGFLDANGDNNLTIGVFGPTEPWDIFNSTRPQIGLPRFDRVALTLPQTETNPEPIILRLR
jgi:uncharacterized protein (DUF2141 family)